MPLPGQDWELNIGDTSDLDVIERQAALQMYCPSLTVKIGSADIARRPVEPDA
jgi:hypothetical protein